MMTLPHSSPCGGKNVFNFYTDVKLSPVELPRRIPSAPCVYPAPQLSQEHSQGGTTPASQAPAHSGTSFCKYQKK